MSIRKIFSCVFQFLTNRLTILQCIDEIAITRKYIIKIRSRMWGILELEHNSII